MCGCRSPLGRACPPPPHIKKAFDLKWYNLPSYKLGKSLHLMREVTFAGHSLAILI